MKETPTPFFFLIRVCECSTGKTFRNNERVFYQCRRWRIDGEETVRTTTDRGGGIGEADDAAGWKPKCRFRFLKNDVQWHLRRGVGRLTRRAEL